MKSRPRLFFPILVITVALLQMTSCTLIQSKSVPEGFVLVKRGCFTMGDTWGEGLWFEFPVHQVTLTYDFYIGIHEVTFAQYDLFCDDMDRPKPWDRGWGRGQKPVINVTWWDAIAYCNWLSQREGLPVAYRLQGEVGEGNLVDTNGVLTLDITKVVGYRLPTEAEWEYAAKEGERNSVFRYSGSENVEEVAWYSDNSGIRSKEVGTKEPNALGIYDMSGNVWEWCTDRWYDYTATPKENPYVSSGSNRVVRGGSSGNIAFGVRVTFRVYQSPTFTDDYTGFRVARTAQ